jgi:molecular chaperone DnaJ
VPTLNGSANLKIPAGTQSGTVLRLKGKGIKQMRGSGTGDLYVRVKVRVPENPSGEEKKCIQMLDKHYSKIIDTNDKDFYKKVQKL